METPPAHIIMEAMGIDLVVESIFRHLDFESMLNAEQASTHWGRVIGNNSTRIWRDLLTRNVQSGLWRAAYDRLQEPSSWLELNSENVDYHRKLCDACHHVSRVMKNNWENGNFSIVPFRFKDGDILYCSFRMSNGFGKYNRFYQSGQTLIQSTEIQPFPQKILDEFFILVNSYPKPLTEFVQYILTNKLCGIQYWEVLPTNTSVGFNPDVLFTMSEIRTSDSVYLRLDYWQLSVPTDNCSIGRRSIEYRDCYFLHMFIDREFLVLAYVPRFVRSPEIPEIVKIEVRPTSSLEKVTHFQFKGSMKSCSYYNGLIAVLSRNSSIRIFNLGTGKRIAKIQGPITFSYVGLNSTHVAAVKCSQALLSLWKIEQLVKAPEKTASPIEISLPVPGKIQEINEMNDSEIVLSLAGGKLIIDAFPARSQLNIINERHKKCPKRIQQRKYLCAKTRSGRVTKPVVRYQA